MIRISDIRRYTIASAAAILAATAAAAQTPLYVVGGEMMSSIDHIPQSNIESIDTLPADEETVALYGQQASHGVIVVTLRYDTPAKFEAEGFTSLADYAASHVEWDDRMPVAKVSLRYRVDAEGGISIEEILQSTDKRLLRRIMRAIETAPKWRPAMRAGEPVESEHLLNVTLPKGRRLAPERGIILL